MTEVRWCCPTLLDAWNSCGERGLGFFAATLSIGDVIFVLQFRSRDREAQQSQDPTGARTTLVLDVPIRYCPFCGANLNSALGEHAKKLLRQDLLAFQ